MRVRAILLNFSILIFCCYCNKTENTFHEPGNKWTPEPIKQEDIYRKMVIDDYLFNLEESIAKDSIIKESKKLFLKGIDAFKNKKDLKMAIELTKKALSLYPEAKAYYELGNALMLTNNYSEAKSAFEEAVEFDFNPKAPLYYQIAFCYLKENNSSDYQIKQNLELAIKHGLLNQPDFNSTSLEIFKGRSWYSKLISVPEDTISKEQLFFQSFVEGFDLAPETGYELRPEDVNMTNQTKQFISYDYAPFIKEMENMSFGRDVSHEFFYLSQVHHTDNYIALVYGSEEISYDGMANIAYYMVTFNKEGQELDKQLIGCNCSAEKVKSFSIKSNRVEVTQYHREWEKDLKEVSISDNKVKNYIEGQVQQYFINDQGNIDIVKGTTSLL